MKRILSIASVFVLILTLAACVSKPQEPKDYDLDAVYQAILDAQNGSGQEALVLFPSDEGMLELMYPGITQIQREKTVFYTHPITGFATEILLLKVSDPKDLDATRKILEDRISNGADDKAYPETAVLWQRNAKVHSSGNYLCMIVLPDGYTIPTNVFDLVSE